MNRGLTIIALALTILLFLIAGITGFVELRTRRAIQSIQDMEGKVVSSEMLGDFGKRHSKYKKRSSNKTFKSRDHWVLVRLPSRQFLTDEVVASLVYLRVKSLIILDERHAIDVDSPDDWWDVLQREH